MIRQTFTPKALLQMISVIGANRDLDCDSPPPDIDSKHHTTAKIHLALISQLAVGLLRSKLFEAFL